MAQPNHPPFIADAAGSAGVSIQPAAGAPPPKDLIASRPSASPAAPAGALPADLFPNRPQQARPASQPHVTPDPASKIAGTPFKDTASPGQPPTSTSKPFKNLRDR